MRQTENSEPPQWQQRDHVIGKDSGSISKFKKCSKLEFFTILACFISEQHKPQERVTLEMKMVKGWFIECTKGNLPKGNPKILHNKLKIPQNRTIFHSAYFNN